MEVFIGIVSLIASLAILYRIYLLYLKKEEDEEKARFGWEMLVWPIILSALLGVAVDRLPNIISTIESWRTSTIGAEESTESGGQTFEASKNSIPEIYVNIGEMHMEIGDTYVIPYTVNVPIVNDDELIWESTNENCVVVDSAAKLTAVATGQAMISVSHKEYPDATLATFRVFVYNDPPVSNTIVNLEYDCACEKPNDEGKYYIFFNINKLEGIQITNVRIEVFSDYLMMNYEEEYTPSSPVKANCAGTFSLDYYGTYLVVCTAITADGAEYQDVHILRPHMELTND